MLPFHSHWQESKSLLHMTWNKHSSLTGYAVTIIPYATAAAARLGVTGAEKNFMKNNMVVGHIQQ